MTMSNLTQNKLRLPVLGFAPAAIFCPLICLMIVLFAMPVTSHAQRRDKKTNRAEQIRGKRPVRGQKLVVLNGPTSSSGSRRLRHLRAVRRFWRGTKN